jgi:hypothetical protein
MTQLELLEQIRFITNSEGQQTDVVVPISVWQQVLASLALLDSGLHPEDENEPKDSILADLVESVRAARRGETYPIAELWEKVYE